MKQLEMNMSNKIDKLHLIKTKQNKDKLTPSRLETSKLEHLVQSQQKVKFSNKLTQD